jgi:hypothetical protein
MLDHCFESGSTLDRLLPGFGFEQRASVALGMCSLRTVRYSNVHALYIRTTRYSIVHVLYSIYEQRATVLRMRSLRTARRSILSMRFLWTAHYSIAHARPPTNMIHTKLTFHRQCLYFSNSFSSHEFHTVHPPPPTILWCNIAKKKALQSIVTIRI